MTDELDDFYRQVGTRQVESGHIRSLDVAPSSPGSGVVAGPVSAWALSGDRYWGITQSLDRLPAACYRIGFSPDVGIYLQVNPLRTDSLLLLPDSKSVKIVEEIKHFMGLREAFESRGFLYKRGVLLWGPPGSGKTSTLHLLMALVVAQHNGIGVLIDIPKLGTDGLQLIRKIEPERQIIAILEDLDGLIASHGIEEYLSMLDGESQIDNVIFVATTNYPELLDKRLVDRPSRFDTIEYIGMPSPDARRAYLRHKEPTLPGEIIEQMVVMSDGFSVAHLRELIILTQCFGRSIEDSARRMVAHRRRLPSSDRAPDGFEAGFAVSR